MRRRNFLQALPAASLLASAQQPEQPPNIVFILSDDMGWGDIEPFGVKDIKTPHLSRLAKGGARFTNAYSNGPVCSPTRTSFLTGRYHHRFGIETALVQTNPDHLSLGLPSGEPAIASILKASGYSTAIYGKWHVGFEERHNPLHHGFDEFFGFLGGNIDMYSHKDRSGTDDLYEGTKPVKKEGYATDLFAQRGVEFIERQQAGKPFFLYLPFNAVHWPFQPPNRPRDVRNQQTWLDGNRQDYKLMLEGLDAGIGRVLDALDRKNFSRNTIVVFTNDNGGERFSNNGGLFHHKGTVWEGGIRVPAIARWPGVIRAGSVISDPVTTFDFTASFLAAAGAKLPAGKKLDGVDVLRSKPAERQLFWRFNQPQGGRRQWAVRRGKWKLVRDGSNQIPATGAVDLLFDIEKDPHERNDLALANPELVDELRRAIQAWEADVGRDGRTIQ